MFKELFSAFRSGGMLDEAFAEFDHMLEHAQWMFHRANEVLTRSVPPDQVRDAIYARDQSINRLLRSIRGKIVRHLTINPGGDVAACLALISVAKDAERIGDYCKNVFEVGRFYNEDFKVERYHQPLEAIRTRVATLFEDTRRVFRQSDAAGAKKLLREADAIGDACDDVINRLLHDSEAMTTHEAVAYSLLARHFKRVSSHLSNVTTAVLGRIEDLDFRP